jgi:tetratricopeptide (TPR) repeat protein
MSEGYAWIDELRLRADELDGRSGAELLFLSAVTAAEVGDDERALAALKGIGQLGALDDPYLASAAQLALSWTLPIVDDFDGALRAAVTALEGFREQDEPFVAFAALTAGMLEMSFGRSDEARAHLTEVVDLGGRLGNSWLESGARAQLASLAVRGGQLDDARACLKESVDVHETTALGTIPLTFALLSYAELALAEGAAPRAATALGAVDGLRQRAGLQAWPLLRRSEAELIVRVQQASDPAAFKEAFAAGSELSQREVVTLVRGAP